MPTSCSAFGCTNRHKTRGKLQFFSFPLKNPKILPLWVKAIKRDNFIPSPSSKVCGVHFTPSDYLERPGTYIQRLKPNAVPSIFPIQPTKNKTGKTKVLAEPEINVDVPEETTSDPLGRLDIEEKHQTDGSELLLSTTKTPCDLTNKILTKTDKHTEKVATKKSELKIHLVYCDDKEVQTTASPLPYTDTNVRYLRHKMKTLHQQLRRRDIKIKQLKNSLRALEENGVIEDVTGKICK